MDLFGYCYSFFVRCSSTCLLFLLPNYVKDIEKVSTNVIQKDFEQDERLFDKLVKLYNDEQTESKDAFTLRDLSLQCAINHQKAHIKDVTNIKQRHPLIAASLQYAGLCYQIQAYFNNHYHSM